MCLKRIAAIWAEDDGAPAGLPRHRVGTSEDADHFADGSAVILYVFDHFMAEDQVESAALSVSKGRRMNGAQPYGRTVTLIAPLRLSRAMANASDARSSGKVWVTSGATTSWYFCKSASVSS